MFVRKNRIGFQYEFLTIKEFIGIEKTYSVFLCQCICGNVTQAKWIGKKLSKKSCGCKKYFRRFIRQPGPTKNLKKYSTIYNRYRRDALERKLDFSIEYLDFINLIQKNCYYCNKRPSNQQKYNQIDIIYNGLDRVNNRLGYLLSNVVTCCEKCNSSKKSITPEIIMKAYHFLFGLKNE